MIPFILLLSSSFTDETTLLADGYSLIPKKFSTVAYQYILSGAAGKVINGYGISIFTTMVGTICSLTVTALLSYPLSRKDLPGRNFFMLMIFFSMLFNGGLVSSYMMWTQTFHVKNTIGALIFPNLMMSAFYVIMMRSYFVTNIPLELIDSSKIDGAGEFRTFLSICLPLSKPMLATLGFMTALGYWNDWTNGLYYVTDSDLFGIQNILNRLLNDAQFLSSSEGAKFMQMTNIQVPSVSMRMAVAVLGMVPILISYPFFQKFLVKGITMGGVKG
jgi:putative aldouronate transport system permease protein